jgi:hypothetical protein
MYSSGVGINVSTDIYIQDMGPCRKDVEDLFGILKKRFQILRTPILFNNESSINSLLKTYCILHKVLMDWDGIPDLGCEDDHWIANGKTDLCDILEQRLR